MFTGIIEALGTVVAVDALGDAARVRIAAPGLTEGMRLGDSLAINGVCLTVAACEGDTVEAGLIPGHFIEHPLLLKLRGVHERKDRRKALPCLGQQHLTCRTITRRRRVGSPDEQQGPVRAELVLLVAGSVNTGAQPREISDELQSFWHVRSVFLTRVSD